jgi:uncharacterized protein
MLICVSFPINVVVKSEIRLFTFVDKIVYNKYTIMGIKDIFKRKPNKFLLLLHRQTELTAQGLYLLTKYLKKRKSAIAKQIDETEREADEVRRVLVNELMRTFVTPFDREDIHNLSRSIDDVLDYANTTVEEMEILDVTPTPFMVDMAKLLYEASREINLSVARLETNHIDVAASHAQEAKSLENQVELIYRQALADLFQGPEDVEHIIDMLKAREVYRHLSNAADRQDIAANVIHDITVKMS